jgi:hypothetical protein
MLTLSSGKNTFLGMFEDYRLSLIYKNIHFYLFQSCNNIPSQGGVFHINCDM